RSGITTETNAVNWTVTGTGNNPVNATDFGGTLPSGILTFAANETSKVITVNVNGDTTVEPDESFTITLSNPTNGATITNATATGTITNDDTSITLAVSPSSVTEDGTTNLVYTFTRTGVTTNPLTVNYTLGGTATLNTDYTRTGTTNTVTFAAGSSTATVTVDPTADTTVEPNETVILTLAAGTGYTIGTSGAVAGTITNDDQINVDINPPQLTKFDVISDSVVTSNQAQSIQISLDIIDDLSGLQSASIVFTSPSGTQTISTTIYDGYDRISGNGLNGIYQKSLTLPRFSETGTWRLRDISLYDKSDKGQYLIGANLTASGFDLDFEVTGIGDTISPDIVGLTISPKQIDTSKNSTDVEVTIQATDNLSGLQYLGITFVSPSGKQTLGNTIWADYDRVSGDGVNGVYKKTLTLPALSETGTWKIRDISLYDNTGNGKYFTRSELTNPNFDLNFVVGITQSAPTLAITPTNATQTEGNSGNKAFNFTVTRSGITTETNAVNWTVTGTGNNPVNATDFGGTLP
ncbi:MAG: hypothetical protein O9350_16260, partial [Microcystis sp. LE19-388.1G]|nr:hypothetical protein [Microcystis sp. LE19-388.1G]